MKAPRLSEDVATLSDLKSKAPDLLRRLAASDRPLIITQNGKIAAVMLSPSTYDVLAERDEFIDAVSRGLRQAEAGGLVEHQRAMSLLRESVRNAGERS